MRQADWISGIAWFVALSLAILALYLGISRGFLSGARGVAEPDQTGTPFSATATPGVKEVPALDLPATHPPSAPLAIQRTVALLTNIPNRPRQEVQTYTVEAGDSVFGIAAYFNIQPETILWSNYEVLKDNPHAITVGMALKIPPVDGIYYQWQEADTLEAVAANFETAVADIMNWPGNRLDLTNPQIEPEAWVMIPGGKREFQQWIVPIIPRGAAGVSAGIYGAGACPGGYEGLYGSGGFIWPTGNHTISGNDYWSGHLAIDIGAVLGERVMAADSGVIVFAGWATGGYGNAVAIDHGNGYQTLYAHLNNVNVSCGQSVSQGQAIGAAGSTGNSTGPHLHFEIRYQGGFVNPWYVLPPP